MGYMRIPTHSGHPPRGHLGDVVDFYHFSFSAHGLLLSGQIELEGT